MAIAPPTGFRPFAAWVLIFLILETTRRVMGLQLVLFTAAFLVYAKFGNHIPGTFHHWGFEWDRIADYTSLSTEGIFGAPVYVCATIIIYFLIFLALLCKELELVKGESSPFHPEALQYYRERGWMK